tara:strand:+ start:197 stop:388 length:192 start_codon:yes stop_codon:yes gene_type:complete
MSYTPENQRIERVTEELKTNFKEFRKIAENRLMDKISWSTLHRLKLKEISDKMYDLQLELNDF